MPMEMECVSVSWREERDEENERGFTQPGFSFPVSVSSEKSLGLMARLHIPFLALFYSMQFIRVQN